MSQTRYLRTIYRASWRDRILLLWRGRLAISATIYRDAADAKKFGMAGNALHEVRIGSLPRSVNGDRWIATGEKS